MIYERTADMEYMKTYSMDLRERVWQVCQQKQDTEKEIAKRFGVSVDWVRKIKRLHRKTGSIAPLPNGGDRRSIFTGKLQQRLKQAVEEQPDATLNGLRNICGVKCSLAAVWGALKKLGYTRKKRRYVPANKSAPT
jgi:transposase